MGPRPAAPGRGLCTAHRAHCAHPLGAARSVSTVYKAVDDACGAKVVIKSYHKKKMQASPRLHTHVLPKRMSAWEAR
jgi:hypothetical protein